MSRMKQIPKRDRYFRTWFIGFGIATTILATIQAIGNPVGADLSSHIINISKAVAINGIAYLIWTIVFAALFSFIYLPLPRITLASFSYASFLSVFILQIASSGTLFSYIVGIGYSFTTMILCLLFIVLFHKQTRKLIKLSFLIMILVLSSIYLIFDRVENKIESISVIADYTGTVTEENPAEMGKYDYTFLTYGSGHDLQREEFGNSVDVMTPTVDASHFITKWEKDRENFWGFNPSQLPVNGRTWLPKEQGPFPIILMVHGNHTMEYFSTSGYDYLGELLASRGFIAISVDEDFINYSNVSGSPNNNYELRAWMLLQHLAHLQQLNETPTSVFYQKIDFNNVGLMGHSRGGQAALMAADYTTFFEDDDLLKSMEAITIKGVVAIAPTDKKIQDKNPTLHNISHLLIHGARDADVSDFRRDRQFYRTTFDKDYDGFNATLYIADANHTQFNTNWGRMDLSLPRGLFLNQKQTMPPEDQQQIAKVYLSAFFESIFSEKTTYEKLFQDYRYGKSWLPNTTIVSKYRNSTYRSIIKYRRAEPINLEGFIKSDIIRPEHRQGHNRLQNALHLEWTEDTSYQIDVSSVNLEPNDRIVLTMANVNDTAKEESVPEIQIELETMDGIFIQMPLDDFMPFPPVISTDYTHFGLFDNIFRDGKYKKSWEPIFQTFEIPIETFLKRCPELKMDNINNFTMHFSKKGSILIEEIGVY